MPGLENSTLLNAIIQHAKELCNTYHCGLTRELILAAAYFEMKKQAGTEKEDADREEFSKTEELLSASDYSADELVARCKEKEAPSGEGMLILVLAGEAVRTAEKDNRRAVTADVYVKALLASLDKDRGSQRKQPEEQRQDSVPGWLKAMRGGGEETVQAEQRPEPAREQPAESSQPAAPETGAMTMVELMKNARELYNELNKTVLGQQLAISTFAMDYFIAGMKARVERDRVRPSATFLFAGPPGVGKTFLSETAAKTLGLPFLRLDMTEYSGPDGVHRLAGTPKSYQGAREGDLTGFVSKNPRCIVLFDEIEKANEATITLFLQVLDAGRLQDAFMTQEISFRDTTLIFTTNAGHNLYETETGGRLSTLSRDVILEALRTDINPHTHQPFFPAAICSRLATGSVLMFDYLGAHILRGITESQLHKYTESIRDDMGIEVEIDPNVPTALLLEAGGNADGRIIRASAEKFFLGELYELYRLLGSQQVLHTGEIVQKVRFSVDLEHADPEILDLYRPSERIHVLVCSGREIVLPDAPDVPIIHNVRTAEEAKEILKKQEIQMIICDVLGDLPEGETAYLNPEDVDTPARAFLHYALDHYPKMPVMLLETADRACSEEEKESYLKRGVQGFIKLDEGDQAEAFRQYANIIFQQNSLNKLARANKLVHFETAQRMSDGGKTAEIILFDMRMETAVRAEDRDSVVSLQSLPDDRLEDVIGAEDAKAELRFYIDYMKKPRKLMARGVTPPKGLILYGPPGTGKTMLARAFAAECGATFIPTEGNKFFNKWVGEGPAMVHRLFGIARKNAPSVLFVDEFDVIARTRSGDGTTSSQITEEIMTAFFSEMDGFSKNPDAPVLVLAATNYNVEPGSPMSLDEAIVRRFDRSIRVDLPSLEERVRYLTKKTSEKPVFRVDEEGIRNLASRSAGMSLAKLEQVLNMAIRSLVRKDAEAVTNEMLDEAFEEFTSGEKREWAPETVLRTARHEAGHALVAYLYGDKPSYVTIVSRGTYGGYVQTGDNEKRFDYNKRELLALIRTSLAGRAAELVFYGDEDGLSTGASSDLRKATQIAEHMLGTYGMDAEFGLATLHEVAGDTADKLRDLVNRILQEELEKAMTAIRENNAAYQAVVDALVQKNSLKGEELDRIIKSVVQ